MLRLCSASTLSHVEGSTELRAGEKKKARKSFLDRINRIKGISFLAMCFLTVGQAVEAVDEADQPPLERDTGNPSRITVAIEPLVVFQNAHSNG